MAKPRRSLKMARPSGMTERLVSAFLLGLALFNPPLLAVFGHGGSVGGVPLLYAYLFFAWLAMIAALALIIERADAGRAADDDEADEEPGDAA